MTKTQQPILLYRISMILCFSCSVYSVFAQVSTTNKFHILIDNSTHFYENKDMAQAIKQAKKAYEVAEEIGNKEWMGIALQKEAFALIKNTKKVKSSRKKAKEKLEGFRLSVKG